MSELGKKVPLFLAFLPKTMGADSNPSSMSFHFIQSKFVYKSMVARCRSRGVGSTLFAPFCLVPRSLEMY